jgi:hypothetical protein
MLIEWVMVMKKSGEPSKFIGRGALQLTGIIINCFQISLVIVLKSDLVATKYFSKC